MHLRVLSAGAAVVALAGATAAFAARSSADSVLQRARRPQRKSLFDSMSNHMAKSVNCDPKMRSRATSTTVAAVI